METRELERLRAHVGEAIFQARLAEAHERSAVCERAHAELCAGDIGLAEALRRAAPDVPLNTARRWWRRWERAGMAGLVDRRAGPPSRRSVEPWYQLELPVSPKGARNAGEADANRRLRDEGAATKRRRGRKAKLLVKWAGSKAAVADRLAALAPREFGTYHEPFVGSGALFFALRPARSRLSDRNAELMNVYRVVRDAPADLIAALGRHVNTRAHFERVRGIHPDALAPVERAARTVFLNRTCFNGLYRVNRKGLFNVPYGRMAHTTFVHADAIWSWHGILSAVELGEEDFADFAELARRGDFLYFDPPYDIGLRGDPTHPYQAGGFDEAEQRRLAELVRNLDRRGCRILVSSADSELIRDLYRGFRIERLTVRRNVGATTRRRGRDTDLVIRNYDEG